MSVAPAVLVVGEALVDVILGADGQRRAHPGGSPANVAFGLARLGGEVSLLTDLGDDEYGRLVREHLLDAGVRLLGPNRPGGVTSTATAVLAADGSARYDISVSWDIDVGLAPAAPAVLHTGSLAAVLGDDRIARLLAEHRGRSLICYDPNIRPDAMGTQRDLLDRVEQLIELSDLVKVSDEDLRWLYPGTSPDSAARAWSERGPRAVVMTRGADGAASFTDGVRLQVPPFATTVTDTVGAGDSFMAALLHFLVRAGVDRAGDRLLDPDDWRRALTFASAAAAITVSRAGADLPRLPEVEALLRATRAGA